MKLLLFIVSLSISSVLYAESEVTTKLAKLEGNQKTFELESDIIVPYPKIDVNRVFELFLRAVDRGQLQVFNKTLSREMLRPLQVEYVYNQEDPHPSIQVFSVLDEPLSLPSMPDIQIMGVIGVMDIHGNIVESIVHCDM